MSPRSDGRAPDELRATKVTPGFMPNAEGSVLYEAGNTRVIATASVEDRLPRFLEGTGKGWVTAEYSMLPRATDTRNDREVNRGRPGGRTQEIQRLIGRSLRAVCDLRELGEHSIYIDCDVIQADGGTRTASISAGYIALALALRHLVSEGLIERTPLKEEVAAVSVGVIGDEALLDLSYEEDSKAEVDLNLVMTGGGRFIELQGTAEGEPFTDEQLDQMIDLGRKGIDQIVRLQREILEA